MEKDRKPLIGMIIVGFAVLMLINALSKIFSYDVVERIWPFMVIFVGLAVMAQSKIVGAVIVLIGTLEFISRYSFALSEIGQTARACIIAIIGLLLIVKLVKPAKTAPPKV